MNKEKAIVEDFSLEKLRAGDRAEFALLMDVYSGVVYRLGIKMLDDPQDAEDILQETFIKAYRYLGDFDGRSSLSTWLYRIATNEALMLIRKRKNTPLSIDEQLDQDLEIEKPFQIVDWCCLPEKEMMSAEARRYMHQAVEQLSPNLRAVFVLRDIEGLSTEETSRALNLSESAVKTRLSRARMRLRELLTAYFSERMAAQGVAEAGDD